MPTQKTYRKPVLRITGKNNKILYYLRTSLYALTPEICLKHRYNRLMEDYQYRKDITLINERVNYYCKLVEFSELIKPLALEKLSKTKNVYHRDFFEYSRYFNKQLYVCTMFGDNTKICPCPCIVKSRPISADNQNDVVLNMDKVRHFTFLKDNIIFTNKMPTAVYRAANYQPHRQDFMRKYFGSEWVDCGDTSHNKSGVPDEWRVPLMTFYDHLKWRYIISLEGNDVASNLKWIMSSNSIAVMPKPKFETWFMEDKLIGDYHYIEISDDYSDLPEKLTYYNEHLDEAQAIIDHAHEYIAQFRDAQREDIISLLVLKRYFELTNPDVRLTRWE